MEVEILLPKGAKLNFNPPKKVKFGDPVFKILKTKKITIEVSTPLGIKPEKIYNYLKKLIGDEVKKEDIIAEKKGFLSSTEITSPVDGKIVEINHLLGTITIETEEGDYDMFKELEGEILEKKEDKVLVKLNHAEAFKIKKTNIHEIIGGELFITSFDKELNFENLKNKITLLEKPTEYLENKLLALQTKAIITLYPPTQNRIPFVQLVNIKDFEKIKNKPKKYTLIDTQSKIVYIYN